MQWVGSIQAVPTIPVNPALYKRIFDMFDKERFHNALALLLGYECIVKDKRIFIEVEESDDPWVSLKILDYPEVVKIKVSDISKGLDINDMPAMQDEINHITAAVHQAYIEANRLF